MPWQPAERQQQTVQETVLFIHPSIHPSIHQSTILQQSNNIHQSGASPIVPQARGCLGHGIEWQYGDKAMLSRRRHIHPSIHPSTDNSSTIQQYPSIHHGNQPIIYSPTSSRASSLTTVFHGLSLRHLLLDFDNGDASEDLGKVDDADDSWG
jgi:hypothetical protein